MSTNDYWFELIEGAASDYGIPLTKEQIDALAGAAEMGHECYGQAFYSPPAGEHYRSEIQKLEHELEKERSKVPCREGSVSV